MTKKGRTREKQEQLHFKRQSVVIPDLRPLAFSGKPSSQENDVQIHHIGPCWPGNDEVAEELEEPVRVIVA